MAGRGRDSILFDPNGDKYEKDFETLTLHFLFLSADVGGNMGLFLGCSLLTLCEFVDLLIIMCLRCWRKRNAVDLKGDQFQ